MNQHIARMTAETAALLPYASAQVKAAVASTMKAQAAIAAVRKEAVVPKVIVLMI